MRLSLIALPIVFAVLKVAAVAGIGWILARRNILHDSATSDISDLTIKVAAPCLVFANAAGGFSGISGATAAILIVSGAALLGLSYIFSAALAKFFGVETGYRTAVVAASTFQNSAYLPLAIGTAVMGIVAPVLGAGGLTAKAAASAAIVSISLFGVLYSPIFWGICLRWITEGRVTADQPLGRLLPPPVIGLIAGYIVGFTPIHLIMTPTGAPLRFLYDAIADVGAMTIPLANMVLGAMLAKAGSGVGEPIKNYAIVIATRFIISPAAILACIWLGRVWWRAGIGGDIAAFIIFLQSVTPPATNLAVMSKRIGKGNGNESVEVTEGRTAEAIPRILLVTYALGMIVIPLWLLLYLHVMGRR